jgi:hypothetical protein
MPKDENGDAEANGRSLYLIVCVLLEGRTWKQMHETVGQVGQKDSREGTQGHADVNVDVKSTARSFQSLGLGFRKSVIPGRNWQIGGCE